MMRVPRQLIIRRVLPLQRLSTTAPRGLTRLTARPVLPGWRSFSSTNVVITKTKPNDHEPLTNNNAASGETHTPNTTTTTTTTTNNSNTDHQQVQITASCWNRIHQLVISKQYPNLYLRVFVDAGGCSGFSYQFELDETELAPDDVVFTSPTTTTQDRLVIDEASLEMLQGSTIDYVQEMIKSSFQVMDNPQSESACGCGSSFALKNFTANPAID